MVQCTEYCDLLGSDCRDSLIIGFRGSPKIHSVAEGEHEDLHSSSDQNDTSLMVEGHLGYDQSYTIEIVESYFQR